MRVTKLPKLRGLLHQALLVILINIPSVSFGLALGWVSLASGEGGESGEGGANVRDAVVAAVATYAFSLVGMPLSALALARGRKFAIIATSASFVVCWSLKLCGGWWGTGSWVAAGLGGAAVWAVAPLLAKEMCGAGWQGAAVSALPLAHSGGVLLMYLAADAALPRRWVVCGCLALSLAHCAVSLLLPESPSFLAAHGNIAEARKSLLWLRGELPSDAELSRLPPPVKAEISAWALVRDMLSDGRRRRAFCIGVVAVMGQEMCGILAVLQYAERVFMLAREGSNATDTTGFLAVGAREIAGGLMMGASETTGGLASPARHAVVLGSVQLMFSVVALYLVERIGRRPLLIWSSALTGLALAAAAALVGAGGGGGGGGVGGVSWAGAALGAAVAADAAGLQSAPYALLADMFHYQYRGCAMLLALAGADVGNALEVAVFPAVAALGGLAVALAVAAALTFAYTAFVIYAVPETRNRSPEEIYDAIGSHSNCDQENGKKSTNVIKRDEFTKDNNINKFGLYLNKENLEKSISPAVINQNCESKNIYGLENNSINKILNCNTNYDHKNQKTNRLNQETNLSNVYDKENGNFVLYENSKRSGVNTEELTLYDVKDTHTDVNVKTESESTSDSSTSRETNGFPVKKTLNSDSNFISEIKSENSVIKTNLETSEMRIDFSDKDGVDHSKECTEAVYTRL